MTEVRVTRLADGRECAVEVSTAEGTTRHTVAVRPGDLERWARAGETPEQFVRRVFDFLLARESNTQILGRFGLAEVRRYFPEFDEEIR